MNDFFSLSSPTASEESGNSALNLLSENRRLRAELTTLKLKVERLETEAAAAAKAGPSVSSSAFSAPSNSQLNGRDSGDDDDESEEPAVGRKKGPRPASGGEKRTAALRLELNAVTASHAQLRETFSNYMLEVMEREKAYATVFQSMKEEVARQRKEAEAEAAAAAAQLAAPPPPPPPAVVEAGPQIDEAALTAVSQALSEMQRSLGEVLGHLGGDNTRGLLGVTAARKGAGALAAIPRQGRRRATASSTATASQPKGGITTADSELEEDDETDLESNSNTQTSIRLPPGQVMSAAFRRELQRNQASASSQALNLPKGAGSLRTVTATTAGVPRKRGRSSVSSATKPSPKTATAADGDTGGSGRRGKATKTDVENPFEALSQTTFHPGTVGGLSARGIPGSDPLTTAAATPEEHLEKFLLSSSAASTQRGVLEARQTILKAYQSQFVRMAEDIKHVMLKRCTALAMTRMTSLSSARIAGGPGGWAEAVSEGCEEELWYLMQRVLKLDSSEQLLPCLESTLLHAVQSMLRGSGFAPSPLQSSSPSAPHPTDTSTALPQNDELMSHMTLHLLTTALAFLWLQRIHMPGKEERSMAARTAAVKETAMQLILDGTVLSLQMWQGSSGEGGVGVGGGQQASPPSSSHASSQQRAVVLLRWMTLLRGLVGRTMSRMKLLPFVGCSTELYDSVFSLGLLVVPPWEVDVEEEGGDPAASAKMLDHGMLAYTIKSVMGECVQTSCDEDGVALLLREEWRHLCPVLGWSSATMPPLKSMASAALRLILVEEKTEKGTREDEEDEEDTGAAAARNARLTLPSWEKRCGGSLLALRMAVLFYGFNFIDESVRPAVQSHIRCDDVLAYTISSAVMDMQWVAAASDLEGEADGLHAQVSRFLSDYITSLPASSLAQVGTIRVLSVAAVVQLMSAAPPHSIQAHLRLVVQWLRRLARKVVALHGYTVKEDVKVVLPKVLPPDSPWMSQTGRWLIAALL